MNGRILSALALVALGVGCAQNTGGSAQAQSPTNPSSNNDAVVLTGNGRAQLAPFAGVGTKFTASLDQPLDSRISTPGQPITATLTQPIKASDGTVLVPSGTQVQGRVDSISHTHGPRIALRFDSLQMNGRSIPIGSRVISAETNEYRAIPAQTGVTNAQPPNQAGQPGQAGQAEQQGQQGQQGTTQVSMRNGASVQLELTRPVIQGEGLK